MAKQEERTHLEYMNVVVAEKNGKKYASLRKECSPETLGAVERKWIDKDTGVEKSKIEKPFESVSGLITNINILKTKFGYLLQLELTDEFVNEVEILSLSTTLPYGEDVMKKLPNVDLLKPVTFKPYYFMGKNQSGKEKLFRGMSLTQGNDEKVENYFSKDGKATNGSPEPKGDVSKYNEAKWKIYFMELNEFLTEYTTEHFVSKFNKADLIEEEPNIEVPENF